MAASRTHRLAPSGTRDIDEQTLVGEVYMRSLLRSQLRNAAVVLAFILVCLASLPAIFAALPATAHFRLLGLPLPWLVLGVMVYPVLLAASAWYVRAAERTERDFADLVGRRTEPEPP